MTLYYSLVDTHINQSFNINGASESYQNVRVFVNKILRIILHVKQEDHNFVLLVS